MCNMLGGKSDGYGENEKSPIGFSDKADIIKPMSEYVE